MTEKELKILNLYLETLLILKGTVNFLEDLKDSVNLQEFVLIEVTISLINDKILEQQTKAENLW